MSEISDADRLKASVARIMAAKRQKSKAKANAESQIPLSVPTISVTKKDLMIHSLRARLKEIGGQAAKGEAKAIRDIEITAAAIRDQAKASPIAETTAQVVNGQVLESTSDSIALHSTLNYPGMPATAESSGLIPEGLVLDDSQIAAQETLVNGKHVCLIGAAGTGKTTMIRLALARLIYGPNGDGIDGIGLRGLPNGQGPSIALCAFTGIASQVIRKTMPDWLAPACKTIHSLLEFTPPSGDSESKTFYPRRDETNPLDHDIVIIDEASMLGLNLWHQIVNALRPRTRVILIGDLNQLKPVADSTMFAYALSAGIDNEQGWSIAELTTIHRQKEAAANKIIEAAHAILNGKNPVLDKPDTEGTWRVLGYEISTNPEKAQAQIVSVVERLRKIATPGTPDRPLFDPYQDLLLTAGNGYDESSMKSFVQQSPLNAVLSRIIEPPSDAHPMHRIDAGKEVREFAVGHKVMALKNEAPSKAERVTNGTTGIIVDIKPNPMWNGKRDSFGTEAEIRAARRAKAEAAMQGGQAKFKSVDDSALGHIDFDALENFELELTPEILAAAQETEQQASHIIDVEFHNGAKRTYSTAAGVAGIQLAYAVTTHKAQGSQADTVIVIVHQAVKQQLSREWLYTAVTRAARRVIILYTPQGLSVAVNRQQIFGASLREKVNRYRQVMITGRATVRLTKGMGLYGDDVEG